MTDVELLPDIGRCIGIAADQVFKRHRRHVERDDLVQELWLWLYEHYTFGVELLAEAEYRLVGQLALVGDRWARREKAARGGYSPADEVFYSIRQLRDILPDALEPDSLPPNLGLDFDKITALTVDYSDYEAGLADVRAALAAIGTHYRNVLTLHFRFGFSPDGLAVYYGVTTDEACRLLARALRAVQRKLGGRSPWRKKDEE